MNYKIIKKKEFFVLEAVSVHSEEDGQNKASIPAFWAQCRENGTIDALLRHASDKELIFGICYGTKDNSPYFDYSIATVCEENEPVPRGLRKSKIPARTWAVFECVGAMPNAIQDLWDKIVTDYFPTSDYRPTREMDIEAYPDGDMDSADYKSEIWIPVEKAE